ncbi:MAG: phosphoribosylanthranilate isomerase [Brachymonas sp.]|nr:phosphoribosylanthranilate isomerase [Brachymonas sp.]
MLPDHASHHAFNFSAQACSRTRIKMCGMTRAQDVDAAVEAGVDALGFVLYAPSPRAVTVAQAAQLARRLPPGVTPVLLFVNATDDLLAEARDALPHAVWQFHGDETPQRCLQATGQGARAFWRAAHIPLAAQAGVPAFDLLQFCDSYSRAQAILLDAQVAGYGGGGKVFDWSQLSTNVDAHLVLSGGLTPANVGDGIACLCGRGRSLAVDVCSGVEQSKGIKDAAKIRAFVAAVRAADAAIAASAAPVSSDRN